PARPDRIVCHRHDLAAASASTIRNPRMEDTMKTIAELRCIPTALALGLATAAAAEPATFEIDAEHFSIGFLVEHVGYADTLGQFLEAEGHFVYDESANEL